MNQDEFAALLERANAAGVRLEMIGGVPLWEPSPARRHQQSVDRIRATIAPIAATAEAGCTCLHIADVYIRFPDGSFKRPDISIFCREPDEQDEAITLHPEAVIEVVSAGHEAKDLEIGPHFYLSQGIQDVIVFDPHTLLVLHIRPTGAARHVSPVQIDLACGWRCVV
ncbi:MAG: Uma2 family endonuclease [Chloroflexaceae bacterium]|nr:Uma2 family endonuclease [Chloroflexaceae bacterium]